MLIIVCRDFYVPTVRVPHRIELEELSPALCKLELFESSSMCGRNMDTSSLSMSWLLKNLIYPSRALRGNHLLTAYALESMF